VTNLPMKETRAPLVLGDLDSFEHELGGRLPESYRSFLLECNGGVPERQALRFSGEKLAIQGATLNYLLGLGGNAENAAKTYSILKYDLPQGLVPIANTPGGNYFLLSVRSDASQGKIYYYDHEYEYDEDEDVFDEEAAEYPPCLVKVAESFDEFSLRLAEI